MNGKWVFGEIQPPISEEKVDAFFKEDVLNKNPSTVMVREGIQNSLDAASDEDKPVKVNIRLEYLDSVPEILSTNDLWKHLEAEDNSIQGIHKEDLLSENEKFPFLVFEDFNTTGLTGDIYALHRGKQDNNYFNFLSAFGGTDKGGSKLGKHGAGKRVFWMQSKINTVFCFSIREKVREGNPKKIFMGTTILNSHAIGNSDEKKHQHGAYGIENEKRSWCRPIEEDAVTQQLAKEFCLKRAENQEPGLSIIVPWPRLNQVKNPRVICESIAEHYFYPILSRKLEASVQSRDPENGEQQNQLDAETIDYYAPEGIKTYVDITKSLIQENDIRSINPTNPKEPDWNNMQWNGLEGGLSTRYINGKEVLLKVGVDITRKGSAPSRSYFKVGLVQSHKEHKRPLFIRGGITIPNAAKSKVKNVTALVIAQEKNLTEFLGEAENPAHTQWQEALLEGKEKYDHAKKVLDFIKDSVRSIINHLSSSNIDKDSALLADIFPSPERGNGTRTSSTSSNPPDPPDVPSPKPQKCSLRRTQDGFIVSNGEERYQLPAALHVEVVYDTQSGSWKYSKYDFQLREEHCEYEGLDSFRLSGNHIWARIIDKKFSLKVRKCFDHKRDLHVSAEVD